LDIDLSQTVYVPEIANGSTEWVPAEPTHRSSEIGDLLAACPGIQVGIDIMLGGVDVPGELTVAPVNAGANGKLELRIFLSEAAYEAIFPSDGDDDEFNEQAKRALVELCVDCATAVSTPGFVLDFAKNDAPTVDIAALIEAFHEPNLESRDVFGLVSGIRRDLIPDVEPDRWSRPPLRYVREAYVVFDLLQPVAP
jgi:hypothetical protein